jgi:Uncharacterized protein conserved in bacteria
MKKILFLHGFTSGGRNEAALVLAQELKDFARIISPDLPLHLQEVISFINDICDKEKPDLIVSISCGTFYAQQVFRQEGVPAILINPFLKMSEFLKPKIGILKYINPRYDGNQEINVTQSLIEEFEELEKHQFDSYDEFNRYRVWGLFGKQDQIAHFRTLFTQYYPTTRDFDGGHIIEAENVKKVLIPMIKEMMETVYPLKQRYFRHFKGNYYKMCCMALNSETVERETVYQALYGDRQYGAVLRDVLWQC